MNKYIIIIYCLLIVVGIALIIMGSETIDDGLTHLGISDENNINGTCIIKNVKTYDCINLTYILDNVTQYQYEAILSDICGNKTVESIKTHCGGSDHESYIIGDNITCYFQDCNGLWVFEGPDTYRSASNAEIIFGISMLSTGGFFSLIACLLCFFHFVHENRIEGPKTFCRKNTSF